MDHQKYKIYKKERRHRRARAKIFGTSKRPRLSVFRSNRHIYLQVVDDEKGSIIASASDFNLEKSGKKQNKTEVAKKVGERLAKELTAQKIKKVVFDRGGYKYHGRVKSAAEGTRAGNLEF